VRIFVSCIGCNFYHMVEIITNHSFAVLSLYRANHVLALNARAIAQKNSTSVMQLFSSVHAFRQLCFEVS
jgi:hypothetical protein